MSRSGYSEYLDNWHLIMWRCAVSNAARGKRGQAFFKALLEALEAMPDKVLIVHELEDEDGGVCAIGSLGRARGIDMSKIDPEDPDQVSAAFDIATCLAQEVVYMNDEWGRRDETPARRWERMHKWVKSQIASAPIAAVEE